MAFVPHRSGGPKPPPFQSACGERLQIGEKLDDVIWSIGANVLGVARCQYPDRKMVNAGSAIIDGEVVVPSADGTTDFSVLQNELKGHSKKIVLVAFDLLYLNGYDLRRLPLFERKVQLKKIIAETDLQFSESFEVDGQEMYKHACSVGLEGVVSKVRDSRYNSGRTNDWAKITCAQRETLAIAGYVLDGKKFGGLYLGRLKGKDLIYAGKVDHGFDPASASHLQARF
jgi:bifunctional non-homologous end joining protein LigD